MSEEHLETASDEKLSQMQAFLIRDQVNTTLGRWITIFGVTNVIALVGIYLGVEVQVSAQLKTKIDAQIEETMSSMRPRLGDEVMNTLKTAAQVRVTYDQLSKDSEVLKQQQAALQVDLKSLSADKTAQVAQVFTDVGDAKNGTEFLRQIHERLDRLTTWSNAEIVTTPADVGTTGPLPPIIESVCQPGSYAIGIKITPVGVTNSGGNIARAVRTVQVECKQLNINK